MALNEQDVQTALKQLIDPNTRLDYVAGKSAKNIKVEGNDVSVDILLGYPAKSQIEPIRKAVAEKLKTLPVPTARGLVKFQLKYTLKAN